MKEINAAYDQIMNKQANPGGQSSGYGGFGGFGGGYYGQGSAAQEESSTMTAVRNFLNYRRYREALTALSGIPEAERGARWQYYSAIANHGAGTAWRLQHAERAASMEPDNEEYQELLEQLPQPGPRLSPPLAAGLACLQ